MQNVFVENIDTTQGITIEDTSIQYTIVVESVEENEVVAQLPVSGPSSVVIEYTPGAEYEIVIENYIRSVEELGLPAPSSDHQILEGYLDGTFAWVNPYLHPSVSPISLDAITGQVIDTLTTNSSGHVTGATLRYLQAADIPILPISKITGLQTALDDRYTETELQGDGTAEVHWNNLTNVPEFLVNGTAQYQLLVTGATPFTPAWTTALNLVGAEGLNSLSYVSASFVKMTGANTFSLDTNTYSLSSHNHDSVYASKIHNFIDTTNHPVSGLTTGHFLKATGATSYGFAAHGLTYSDVGAQQSDATLTALAGLTITQGSIIYGTGDDAFSILAKGTAGQVLKMNSDATAPEWGAASSGTVSFGTDYQIPYMKTTDDDFSYSERFVYDSSVHAFTLGLRTGTVGSYSFVINGGSTNPNTANGSSSFCGGVSSVASGSRAFAYGSYATASGTNSRSLGHYTKAHDYGELAIGTFNIESSGDQLDWDSANSAFVIGNGNSIANLSNAFQVFTNGDVDIYGILDHSLAPNKPKIYTQSTEPDIPNDTMAFWKDTDDSKYYLILDIGGTQKKVELT